MSYESEVEPIKLGYLFDFKLPDGFPQEQRDDLMLPFRMVFADGLAQGLIDRPVEIVFREVEGLPKGSVKAVIDAFGDLVDEGCLAVFGPAITDNAVPTREAIEQRFQVPAISVCGAEEWLGEWTFALPQGSMTDEPIYWADLLAERGHTEVGVLIEGSLIGESYARNFRKACATRGIRVVAEEHIAQTAQDVGDAVRKVRDAQATALVHCGFGFGLVQVNPVLRELGWDPPRVMGTAFENAWINPVMWQAIVGWIGLDQYDEGNAVGQQFLDRFEAEDRSATAVLRAGRQPRPRHRVPAHVRRRASADPAWGAGGARAGEDGAGGIGRAGHLPLVRASGPVGAGWVRATWWPVSSTLTASPRAWSVASERREPRGVGGG